MNTTIEAPAPAKAPPEPRAARPAVPSWRTWLVAPGALALGIGAGVALTYLTVIVPRTRELARRHETTSFLQTLAPQTLFEGLAPIAGKVTWTNPEADRAWNDSRVRGRTFEGHCRLNPSQSGSLLSYLPARLGQVLQREGGYVRSQSSSSSADGAGRREHVSAGYELRDNSGVIHVWTWTRGDDMDVVVMIQEY